MGGRGGLVRRSTLDEIFWLWRPVGAILASELRALQAEGNLMDSHFRICDNIQLPWLELVSVSLVPY